MRFKTVLFICAALIGKCYSANDGNCIINDDDIDWISNIYKYGKIKDTETLKKVFEFEGELALIGQAAGINDQFISVSVDEEQKHLIFETNKDFNNFDESVSKQSSKTVSRVAVVNLKCSKGTTLLRFSVEVEDTNNHDPTFRQSSYTYNMPMPLVPRIDLTSFGNEIIATDLDFLNQNVEFTIDPPGKFEFTTISSPKSKDYRAVLKVTEFMWLTEETTFTITATDSLSPPRQSTASLTITLDETNILPYGDVPKFSASSYRFKYTFDSEGNPTLTPSTSVPIAITSVTDTNAVSVKLDENDYFTANFDPKTKQVTIDLTDKPIDITSEYVIVLTLTVTLNDNKDESSEATILIDVPYIENAVSVPIFTQPYYTATYSPSNTISLDNGNEIAVKQNADNVKIELTGRDQDHFTISKTGDQWQLSVKENLDYETLKKGEDIVLTLSAIVSGEDSADVNPGYATLIVKLPKIAPIEVPRFSKTYYTGMYIVNEDGQDFVTLNDPITASSSGSESVIITFEGDLENFVLTLEADSWIVSVTKELSDDVLKTEREIVLGLIGTAKGEGTEDIEPGYATLILKLPDVTPLEVPRFSKTYYTATYTLNEDGQDSVKVDIPLTVSSSGSESVAIALENSNKSYKNLTSLYGLTISAPGITITDSTASIKIVSEYADNFNIECEIDGKCTLKVTSNLPRNVLQSEFDIVIVLSASLAGVVEPGTATVLINLPRKRLRATPVFSKTLYTTTYTIDDKNSIYLNGESFFVESDYQSDITVEVKGEYEDNFKALSGTGTDGEWKLIVVRPLDNYILDWNTEIVVQLVANLDNSFSDGTAVAVIRLPEKREIRGIPMFTRAYYTAHYTTDATNGPTITIHGDEIAVISDFESDVEVQISDPYNKYFDIKHNTDKQQWELSVIKPLDLRILKDYTEIAIELVSTLDKSLGNGAAVVLVKLPTNEGTVIIKFNDPYYIADYSVVADGRDEVTLNKEIKLNIANAEVTLASEDYADNFDVQCDAGTCHLRVTKNLDADVLTSTTEILVILQASTPDAAATGKTTVIIHLPNMEDKVPKFTKPVYTATYKVDDCENYIVALVDAIEINEYEPDEISVTISGDNSNNFEAKLDDGEWQIEVTDNLPTDVLNSKASIILTLTAKVKGDSTIAPSESKLIIELPKTSASTIYFEENVYTADYSISPGGIDHVTANKEIKLNIDDAEVTIASEDYADNFDVQCDAGTCHLIVTKNLDANVLTSTKEILVVLQAFKPDAAGTGKTTVIIRFPHLERKVPKFTKSAYTANYKIDDSQNHVVALFDAIEINEYEPDKISITISGDDNNNFKATLDDDRWQIEVTNNLPADVLKSKTSVMLTLRAKVKDDSTIAPSESKLFIKLPKTSASSIYFEKNVYTAVYNEDDKSISINGDIIVAGDTADVDVSLDGDYSDNFETTYNDGEVTIMLTEELPSEIVEGGGAITVNLKAVKGTDTALATLVVKLPPVKVLVRSSLLKRIIGMGKIGIF